MEGLTTHTAQGAWQLWSTNLAAGCTGCQPFLFARWVTSLPYLRVTLHPWKDTVVGRPSPSCVSVTSWGHTKSEWPSKVITGMWWQSQPESQEDYSADLNLAPAHPSFRRRTNSYWAWMASSQLIKNTFLLQSQAGLSHSCAFGTGSLQRKSSPGMRLIRKCSFGYSAEPISSHSSASGPG